MNQDQVKTKLLELDNSVEDFTITFSGNRSYPNTWTGATDSNWAAANNWSEGVPTTTHNVYIPKVSNQPTAASAITISTCVGLSIHYLNKYKANK